jgi:glycine dehydrogenase subunit 1
VYLSAVGPEGLLEVGQLNWNRSHRAARALCELDGVSLKFSGPTFNEFVVETDRKAAEVLASLRARGIAAGLDLGRFHPDLERCVLTCVTEARTEADIDRLVAAWREV